MQQERKKGLTSDKDGFVVHSSSTGAFDRQTVKDISHYVTDDYAREDCAAQPKRQIHHEGSLMLLNVII